MKYWKSLPRTRLRSRVHDVNVLTQNPGLRSSKKETKTRSCLQKNALETGDQQNTSEEMQTNEKFVSQISFIFSCQGYKWIIISA